MDHKLRTYSALEYICDHCLAAIPRDKARFFDSSGSEINLLSFPGCPGPQIRPPSALEFQACAALAQFHRTYPGCRPTHIQIHGPGPYHVLTYELMHPDLPGRQPDLSAPAAPPIRCLKPDSPQIQPGCFCNTCGPRQGEFALKSGVSAESVLEFELLHARQKKTREEKEKAGAVEKVLLEITGMSSTPKAAPEPCICFGARSAKCKATHD